MHPSLFMCQILPHVLNYDRHKYTSLVELKYQAEKQSRHSSGVLDCRKHHTQSETSHTLHIPPQPINSVFLCLLLFGSRTAWFSHWLVEWKFESNRLQTVWSGEHWESGPSCVVVSGQAADFRLQQ